MKKTLLCFLFLFTTVFYAQNIVHCPGDNNFDLAKQKILLIGNLNPEETNVSFHLSLADATNNTNAISNPSNYNAAVGTTTIYVRIDNNGTITTNSFNVKVVAALNITTTNTSIFCSGEKASLTVTASGGVGPYYYSLNGGSFSSNTTFNNLSAGVYSIQVLDTGTSCPTTVIHTITAPTILNATAMTTGQMVTITPIGGTAPYQYSLEGINYQLSANFVNLTPGNHVFMVRDINGCMTTVPATVLPSLTTTAIITKEVDCSANSNASITIAAAGGQSPYTYSLNDGPFQANNNFSNLIPGTYSIKAKDAVNTISNPTAITINPLVVLSATAIATSPTSCSTGTITAMATGGKAPYIYSFDGGMTFISSNVFSTPNPGTYVIIVKDSKSCASSAVTATIQPTTPLAITASNTSISCSGSSDASLTISAAGGKAPYQYAINNGVYTSSNIFTGLNAGTYTLKVKDASGCVATSNHVINQPPSLTVNLSTSGNNITLTTSGGTPPYQYSLDGGSYQTSNVFTVLTSGNYLAEVRDSSGCTRTFATAVVVPDPLISSAILIKESDCTSGASMVVNATGGQLPYAYSINGGASYQLSNTFTNVPAGTYTVKVKDFANTFSNSNTIVVNSPAPVTANALVTPSNCIDNSITVQATGGQAPYIYSIDGGATYGPANVFNNVLTGNYNIVVKDSNSCVSPMLSKIVQSPSPLFITASDTSISCYGDTGSIIITLVGGQAPYEYSINNNPYTFSNIYSGLTAGTYTIRVRDAIGCSSELNYVLTEPIPLTATSSTSGQNIVITTVGGKAPYQYSLGGVNYQSSSDFQYVTPGNHIFMARDANGCIATVQVTVLPSLTTTAIITKEMDCSANSNASITIAAAGGQSPYTYSVNGGPFQVNTNFSNLIPGTYSIRAKDAVNTISNPTAITINPLVVLSATAIATNPTSCSTGTITAMATGGKAPYIYSFDGGMTFISSNVFSTPNPGTYVIIVKDSKSCASSAVTATIQPTTPLAITASNTSISCSGSSDASLTISAAGGKAPYQYAINNGVYTSSNIFTGLNAGTYTLKVKDAAGCVATSNHVINQPPSLTVNLSASGNNITLTTSGGTPPYQYSLDGGSYQTSNVFTVLTSGNYLAEVRDSSGCTRTFATAVVVPDPLISSAILIKESDCTSGASIVVNATGGQLPYAYSINGGASYQLSNTFTNVPAGTYTVKVKDFANTVSNSNSLTIAPPVTVNGVALVTAATSCSNASMMVHATSGQAPFYYSIDNGQTFINSNIFNDLTPGNYTFFIKDSKGCVSPPLFNIVQQPPSPLLATALSTPLVCAKDKTTLTINATGGQTPYKYAINNGAFTTTNTFNVQGGTYFITVKDAVGCTISVEHIIAQPTPIYPDIVIEGQTITIEGQSGTAPYEYSIDGSPFQSENIFTNLSAGMHFIRLKDSKGCESYDFSVIIEDSNPLTFTTSIVKSLNCTGNSQIFITATGGQAPYLYSINGGQNYQPGYAFSLLPPGTYFITVKDALNALSNKTITLNQLTPVTATATNTAILCAGETASLTVTALSGEAPFQYSINDGAFQTNNVFTKLKAGTYTINVKDSYGCLVSLSHTIMEPQVVIGDILIEGQTISVVDVTGGTGSYQYAIDNNAFQTSNVFTNVKPGIHNIRLKDSNNCEPGSFSAEITSPLAATIIITKPIECTSNAEIIVTATGGFTPYIYSVDGGVTFQTSNVFSNLVAGTYTVTIKDNDDKLYTKSITINPLMPIYADFLIDKQTLTINGQAGTAPYQYSVDGSSFQTNNIFTNLSPGNHQVYIKDSKGCQSFSFVVTIDNVNQLIASAVLIKEADCTSNAVIAVNVSGGTAPYSYSINAGATFQSNTNFSNIAPGTYSIVVKDANNTLATTNNITVSPLSFPIISVTKINPSCYQASNGIINVQAQGGKAPYMYSIGGGYTSSNVFTNLVAGIYNVTVKDVNGCLSSSSIMIDEPSPIAITTNTANSTTINDNNGKITVIATGGVSSYTYALTNFNGIIIRAFQSSNIFDGLQAGLYGVQVQDANGCIASKTDISIINKINNLSATFTITQITCNDPFGKLTVIAVGGTVPYQYSADNGITYSTSNVFNLTAGSYTLKVRDADNNTTVLATTIADQIAPSFYYNTYKGVCSSSDLDGGGITIAASGGQSPYTYSFNGGPFVVHDDLYENLKPGTYTFSIKDANGCTSTTQSFTIEEPDPIISKVIVENQTITVKALGQGRSYEYSLDGITFQSNSVFSNLKKGTYAVYIRDYKGCTATHSDIIIFEPTSLTANFEITPLTCDSTTGRLNITALGGIAPYQYSIDNGNTYTSSNLFTSLFPGSYAIIVKDAQNTTASSTAIIKPIELLAVTAVATKGIDCLSNASITVNAIGGNGPYTYSIGNGYTTSNIFTNLTSQTYTVSAKDAFGCIATTSATILQPTILSLSNIGTNSKTLGSSDGTITITASGGTAPYQYLLKYENGSQITVPQSSSVFTGLSVGKYTIEVTDAAGCKVNKSGILITSDTIFGTLMTTPVTCTTLGSITINAAGGKYPHQYSFDNGITYGSSNIASNLQLGTYTIKVKDAGGDILTLSTTLTAVNPVVATTAITSPIHCNGSNDAVIQITATGGKTPYFYSINGNAYQSSNTFSNLYAGNHSITVKDSNGCSSVMALAIAEPAVLVSSIEVINQTITMNSSGGSGTYKYAISPNLNQFSTNNTFANLEAGNYTAIVQDESGCYVLLNFVINPPAPLIENKEAITVDFKPGQTLADLTVDGQNIKWYSTPNALEGKTSKINETPLPLTTILVNGTTYYASQTINGIESKERLAVTVKSSGALSTPDFILSNFKYYPNPVLHNLTISNTSIIDEIEIYSASGITVLSKRIDSDHSEIDLSSLQSGVYLMKVKSEGREKTMKIIKK